MRINQAGIDLIKQFEGLSLVSYQDSVGVWTIGIGHVGPDAYEGRHITQEQADDLLRHDLEHAETAIDSLVLVPLTDNQFAALVSFTFNLGAGALRGSTLLRLLNDGDYNEAASQLLHWNHAGGHVLAGLTRRRQAERELFLKP